jgi:WNK lysine deficient protein kinase
MKKSKKNISKNSKRSTRKPKISKKTSKRSNIKPKISKKKISRKPKIIYDYGDDDSSIIEKIKKPKTVEEEISPKGLYIKLNEIIGKGSYKVVYKGFNLKEGSEIAWGSINVSKLNKKEKLRVKNEVDILAKIFRREKEKESEKGEKTIEELPIIEFLGSWYNKDKHEVVIITKLYKDGTLLDYIKNYSNIININHIKRWCKQILEGLIFLHTNDIIHRDLKLANILIDATNSNVYLADFGLSIYAESSLESVGTLIYMAPEMFVEKTYDKSVDMYAFGICLLEMLTKEEAYSECKNISEIIFNKENNILPLSLRKVKEPILHKIISMLLSVNKEDRPTSFDLYTSNFYEV